MNTMTVINVNLLTRSIFLGKGGGIFQNEPNYYLLCILFCDIKSYIIGQHNWRYMNRAGGAGKEREV